MIDDFLQEQAALFAAGAMSLKERERFEILLEGHCELQALTAGLAETAALATLGGLDPTPVKPSPHLKQRLLEQIATHPQVPAATADGLVISSPEGLVHWVNPAFSGMCGYSIEELRGKKLGPILQGQQTDQRAADRMRQAVHAFRPCQETILNYHKDGRTYWVEISLTPIADEDGSPRLFIAQEREVKDRLAA